jgi:hypothetical protein
LRSDNHQFSIRERHLAIPGAPKPAQFWRRAGIGHTLAKKRLKLGQRQDTGKNLPYAAKQKALRR